MSDLTFGQFFSKKAFEISYASFRLSQSLTHRTLGEYFERESLELLIKIVKGEYAAAESSLGSLNYLVRFGADVGLVSISNSDLLVQEIETLQAAIAEFNHTARLPDIDLEGIFSPPPTERPRKREAENMNVYRAEREEDEISVQRIAMRHATILDKIRQSGNCRIKELQDILPDTSERTLRYDLQRLTEQGLIERMGAGPSASYKIKESLESAGLSTEKPIDG